MRFIGYSIQNFKAIKEEILIEPLNTLNVIIGPNNEGKSSIFEPLSLLQFLTTEISNNRDLVDDFIGARLPNKLAHNPFCVSLKFAYETSDIDPEFVGENSVLGSVEYSLTWGIHVPSSDQTHLNIKEIIVQSYDDSDPILAVSPIEGSIDFSVLTSGLRKIVNADSSNQSMNPSALTNQLNPNTASSDVSVEFGLLKFLSWWASKFIYVPSQREVDNIGAIDENTRQIDRASIPALVHQMHSNDEPAFRKFESLVTNLISSITTVHSFVEPGNNTSIRVSNQPGIAAINAFRLDTVGAGVREIIFLAASVWLSAPNSVIVIEEPERGLHSGAQRVFLNSVLEHAAETGKQLFWTTHSTVMAPLIPDCSVFVAGFSSEKTTMVTPVLESDTSPILDALGQKMVDFYNYDLLVMYDGQTEHEVIPLITEELLTSQISRGINFYSLNGDVDSKEELVNALIRALSTGHTKVFIMADDDDGVEERIEALVRANPNLSQDHVHIWDCNVKGDKERRAEFEDNFSKEELILAANQVANDTKLTVEDFKRYLDKNPTKAISKSLQHLYWDKYNYALGKPELGSKLVLIALDSIRGRNPDDENPQRYEFEIAIEKLREILT